MFDLASCDILFPSLNIESVFSSQAFLQTQKLRKKLLYNNKPQTKCISTRLNHIREHKIKFIQESHPVQLAKELLLSSCAFNIIWSMMNILRLVRGYIIKRLNLLFLILIVTNNLLQWWNKISHDSRHKWMIRHLFNSYSFSFIWGKTSSYEIFKILRKVFEQINVIFIDFLNQLLLVAACPWSFSM